MKKMGKRLLTFVLAATLIFSFSGISALAADSESSYVHGTITVTTEDDTTLQKGDTMTITVSPYIHIQYKGCGMSECPEKCEGYGVQCFYVGLGCICDQEPTTRTADVVVTVADTDVINVTESVTATGTVSSLGDTTDGTIRLEAIAEGTTTVTVTASLYDWVSAAETFTVTVSGDGSGTGDSDTDELDLTALTEEYNTSAAIDLSDYTIDSGVAFSEILAEAEAALSDSSSYTQTQIDDLTAKLKAARMALEELQAPEKDEDGYYLLSTSDDIKWLTNSLASGTAGDGTADINLRLANDIVISENYSFAGIGTSTNPYSGIFDGNGYTVTLDITSTSNTIVGFIAYASAATIENLTIDGTIVNSSGTNGTGGVIGRVLSGGAKIRNCTNLADITGGNKTGGMVGNCTASDATIYITDCTNEGSINATTYAGGMAGTATAIYVTDSVNNGPVTSGYGGGLVGQMKSGSVSDCVNNGDITGVGTTGYVAGIVADAYPSSSYDEGIVIEDCMNYGTITNRGSNTGGIAGRLYYSSTYAVTVQRCGNEGAIAGAANTGGVVGYDYSSLTATVQNVLDNLYNAGTVSGYGNTGGIVGSNRTCNISNVYNLGSVSGTSKNTGGIIGIQNRTSGKGYDLVLTNAYNVGEATYTSSSVTYTAGALFGTVASTCLTYLNNTYYLDELGDTIAASGADYIYMEGSETAVTAAELQVTSGELAALADTLGDSFTSNTDADYHMGYPVLTWETDAADDGGDDEVLNGLYADENGALAYYADGVIDTTYTGMVKDADGTWYYVVNGYADTDYTGMVKYAVTGVWYYFSDGSIVWDYTGIAKHASTGVWYYFSDGSIVWDYTGIAKNTSTGVWYYFSDGSIVWDYTGMAKNTSTGVWYYFSDGTIDWNYTGMAKHPSNGLWYYFTNGAIDWTYTGWVTTESGSWYFTNGQIDWSYTAA